MVRSFNGNSFTNTYTGTLADGSIKGKVESQRNGQPQSRDWEASRRRNNPRPFEIIFARSRKAARFVFAAIGYPARLCYGPCAKPSTPS